MMSGISSSFCSLGKRKSVLEELTLSSKYSEITNKSKYVSTLFHLIGELKIGRMEVTFFPLTFLLLAHKQME